MLLRQGVHPEIEQERLGHANVGITLDIYSHVSPNLQADAADTIDAGMRKAMAKWTACRLRVGDVRYTPAAHLARPGATGPPPRRSLDSVAAPLRSTRGSTQL